MIRFSFDRVKKTVVRLFLCSPDKPGASALGYALLRLLLLACLCISCSLPTLGQATTGSIAGTVFDPSKAAIPGAEVTVKNVSTGVTSSTTTNASGHYEFLSLPAGQYTESV